MEQEVLLNSSRARSHKKFVFVDPSSSNAKLDSPYLREKIKAKNFQNPLKMKR